MLLILSIFVIFSVSDADSLTSLFSSNLGGILNGVNAPSPYDLIVKSIKCSCDRTDDLDVSLLKVHTFNNYATIPTQNTYKISEAANAILNGEGYNPKEQCIDIFIDGFNANINSTSSQTVICSFSKIQCQGKGTFGVIIDHSAYTKSSDNPLEITKSYQTAVTYVNSIGKAVADLLNEIFRDGDLNNVSIFGFSLGGHMLGYAGKYLKSNYGMELQIIYTGEAAGPCFDDCIEQHVKSGQAKTVISFHTTTILGTGIYNLSDYDFVVNDGKTQPGCPPDVGLFGKQAEKCNHFMAVPISYNPAYKEGIWLAKKCSSYQDFKSGKCADNASTFAGYRKLPTTSTGLYYFEAQSNDSCNKVTAFNN